MEALTLEDEHVVLNSDRCIGCGLCVSTCPTGSLTLERKSTDRHIPADLETAWKEIMAVHAEKLPD